MTFMRRLAYFAVILGFDARSGRRHKVESGPEWAVDAYYANHFSFIMHHFQLQWT
jgi:hypothetical protein